MLRALPVRRDVGHGLAATVGALATRTGAPALVRAQGRQPNVLLVTIDTLRADRAGPGAPAGAETPILNQPAAQGASGPAYVQLPQTTPNHTSILTGTYIQTHGLRTTLWDKARSEVPTLDQLFRAAGYRTGAIVSWYSFDDELTNLLRAWDTYEQVVLRFGTPERVAPEEARAHVRAGADMGKTLDGDARATTDAALRWLDAYATQGDRPWCFWLHYRDPHYPFTAPGPYGALPQTGRSSMAARPAWAGSAPATSRLRARWPACSRRTTARSPTQTPSLVACCYAWTSWA